MSRRPSNRSGHAAPGNGAVSTNAPSPLTMSSTPYNYNIQVAVQLRSFECSLEYLGSPKSAIKQLGDFIMSDASRSLKVLHYGRDIENPMRGLVLIIWESMNDQLATTNVTQLMSRAVERHPKTSIATGDLWFDAESYMWGVLSAPVVVIQFIQRTRGVSHGERLVPAIADWTSRSRICEGYRDHWFNATVSDHDDQFIVLTGWDGIEAYWQATSSADYAGRMQKVAQYASIDTRSVQMTRYSRFQ
ncbi:hypothetical protein CYLTODRAFT_487832 [Cylindrobasidium torrendii FP15055 ss-10]|uniref:ABM domain-containing protein n=1 Tax=Cylindrobasidium torrendii FP15055 ss-10 TaxID=1314674 RepID=A0A0D7BM72_9AGAR|nr:hypothetical protein CYLTODRAFT_487832 [Cylindrobasidium torrendii FP15055 ss-10]